jgi:predicted HTH transcriptional regulator
MLQVPVFQKYAQSLVDSQVLSQSAIDATSAEVFAELQAKLDASRDYRMEKRDWLSSNWLVSKIREECINRSSGLIGRVPRL